jgi:non-ribosomal peptide synthetase component F
LSALDIRFAADGGNLRVNAPRGALSEALRQRIADHKQALLDFLHRAAAPEAPRLAPVPRVSDEGAAPLSFAQERLWFLEQLEPGGAVFNLCRALRITGALDAVALEASLNAVLRRQEALRTKFIIDGGRPVQAIAPFRHSRLKFVDLSRSSLQERETARVIDAFVRRPFDLTSGRLLRTQLVRLGATEHLLMLGTHHMVADAWSMGLLASEIWTHYAAFARGETLVLPELPVRYRDYAAWQRQQLQGARFESLLAYWTRRLGNAPPLDLPTDRPRPARPSYRGRHQPIVIAAPLTAALNQLSRSENATLFMTLLAGFQVLLHRYSGQEDIVVGTPAANREQPELESVIGLFVNTLVLRSDFTGAPSFRELLQRVRQTCLDGLARRELPFEKLIEALSPRRELNRHPLFQAMFVLQNTPRPMVAPNGLQIESVEIDNPTAQFDLSLYLRERDGKLIGYFEYASELFDASTIERLAENFTTLLESIVAAPERSVAALELFGAGERRLRTEWNDTAAAYPTDRAIHELFEAQAERTPDAIALEFAGARLTYRDLNRRANRLARHLLRIGVGPEKPVAIMIERSPELVIGLLAILKAGGAFVPLDPHYPEARLRFMIEDSQAAVLLTLERSVEDRGSRKEDGTQIPNSDPLSSILDPRLKVVDLDRDGPEIASQSLHDPKTLTNGDSPAYIIYTSGSTGEPKGVVGLHRGAVNRFNWMWRRYPFGANEVCCAKTSIGFVDAVWEIFGPLLQGVRLVLVPDEVAREPSRLIDFLAEHDITRLVLVPSLLRAMLQESAKLGRRLPKLLLWSCSGEALPAELARRFSNSHPRARLLNIYGSSEVAADVTCFEYRAANVSPLFEKGEQGEILQDRRKKIPLGPPFSKGEARSSVPIGRPIDNTQIYLLDSERQPVPVGVAGELYVGGAGLARGYWRRTELTEESFVANPFSIDGDSRMFRSGDLARYLPDGNLQYLGRLDRQVKVRGQRVELGEIETALRTYPAIGDCVVVASSFRSPAFFPPPRRGRTKVGVMPSTTDVHEQAPPSQPFPVKGEGVSELDRTLTAYVVATGANAPDAGELRQFLRATLPEFMVPAAFVMLDALPLTPSGKVDHKALPAPKVDSSFGLPPSIPPRNELEREIAALWRELLNLKEVGIDDDFFALGGIRCWRRRWSRT